MQINLQGANGIYAFDPQDGSAMLGQGGMGVVFKGNSGANGTVAIKVLYKEITANLSAIERERQSAGIRINNKNLIRMLDFVEQNGIFHIVSELVEGRTLHNYLLDLQRAGKRPDNATILNIINQVMDGLIALHSNQPPVIHRDIDPSNIMICGDGTVKIMDFGIAKISDGKRKSLTGMGTVIGKPHYSPPEQIRGESNRINQTTDIYALGITIYEMLVGKPPFNATNEYDVMKMQIERPLPQNPIIPPLVFKVLQKATEKRQEKRYQSVALFKSDINNAFNPPAQAPVNKKFRIGGSSTIISLVVITGLTLAWIVTAIQKSNLKDKYEELQSKYGRLAENASPIEITDITFANTDYYKKVITGYGSTLYASDMRYLTPKILFKSYGYYSGKLPLMLRFFDPNGNLLKNNQFKDISDLHDSYTLIIPTSFTSTEDSKELSGFGSSNSSIFRVGTYKIEIWLGSILLYSKPITFQ